MKRSFALGLCLWFAILSGSVLPAFLAVGYGLASLEVGIVAGAALVPAVLLAVFVPVGSRAGAWIGFILFFLFVAFYWTDLLSGPVVTLILAIPLFVAFTWLRSGILHILAVFFLAGLMTAELNRVTTVVERSVEGRMSTSEPRQTVIHVLLDELTGFDGLPAEVFTTEERSQLTRLLLSRGFNVFPNVVSREATTPHSMSRLFNPGTTDPEANLRGDSASQFVELVRAEIIEAQSGGRETYLYGGDRVSLGGIVESLRGPVRFREYRGWVAWPTLAWLDAPVADRLRVALATVSRWFEKARAVDAYTTLLALLPGGAEWSRRSEIWSRPHPAVSRVTLEDLIEDLSRDPGGGRYYFAHVLLPHFPYVFAQDCSLRPVSEWRITTHYYDENYTVSRDERHDRYRRYFEQLRCTERQLARLIDAVDRNPALRDAVIIVHGDHGTRITIRDQSIWPTMSYSMEMYERDLNATLFAVRLPDRGGRIHAEPAVLHELFWHLAADDFRAIHAGE